MIFIGDTEKGEQVKYIQADPTSFKDLEIISEKDFVVKDISNKISEIKSDIKEEDSEDESEAHF